MTRRRQSPCDLQLKRSTIIIVFNICSFNFYLSGFKIFAVCRFHYPSLLSPRGGDQWRIQGRGPECRPPPPYFLIKMRSEGPKQIFFGDRPPPPPPLLISASLRLDLCCVSEVKIRNQLLILSAIIN